MRALAATAATAASSRADHRLGLAEAMAAYKAMAAMAANYEGLDYEGPGR